MDHPFELAQNAVKIVIEHGTHHSGRKHIDVQPEYCLKSAAQELSELTFAEGVSQNCAADNRLEELADVFIALFHYKFKVLYQMRDGITDLELALMIVKKLAARNEMPQSWKDKLWSIEASLINQLPISNRDESPYPKRKTLADCKTPNEAKALNGDSNYVCTGKWLEDSGQAGSAVVVSINGKDCYYRYGLTCVTLFWLKVEVLARNGYGADQLEDWTLITYGGSRVDLNQLVSVGTYFLNKRGGA